MWKPNEKRKIKDRMDKKDYKQQIKDHNSQSSFPIGSINRILSNQAKMWLDIIRNPAEINQHPMSIYVPQLEQRWKFNYSWRFQNSNSPSHNPQLVDSRKGIRSPETCSTMPMYRQLVTSPLEVELILVKCHRRLVVYTGANVKP